MGETGSDSEGCACKALRCCWDSDVREMEESFLGRCNSHGSRMKVIWKLLWIEKTTADKVLNDEQ